MLNYTALLIPVFLLMVAVEWWISYKKKDNRYQTGNTVINMAIGAFDQFGSLFYFGALYVCLQFSYTHFRLFTLALNWQQWVYAFFAIDFLSYWYHRFSHRINILWAGHITHHSSELFNFSNGFRTSLFQGINRIVFWMLLPLVGFDPMLLLISLKVSGLWDFLVHTTYVPKLGWLEKILVTPSHHRVHHGKNDIYIDKNYGSVLIIWDKLFGTFQEETEEVQYGVKANYTDNNPVNAITYHYRYLWNGIKNTSGIANKIKLIIMPPEWKPRAEDNFSPRTTWNAQASYASERYYALWQLICCVPGFVAILFCKNNLSPTALWYCMSLCITSITQTALIYKDNKYSHFSLWETFRLSIYIFFLPWADMGGKAPIYSLTLYLVLSLLFQLIMKKVLDNYLLKNIKKKMKKNNLYLAFLLLMALLIGSCSTNKTSNYDRFGGGISDNYPVHNSAHIITKKIQKPIYEKSSPSIVGDLGNRLHISEKQQQKINSMVHNVPEVKVAKKTVNALRVMNQKINTRVCKNEQSKTLKTAATLFKVASSLLVLGLLFIGIFGFRYKNETTGGAIGVVMFLIGIILAIIALLIALIGVVARLLSAQFKNTSTNLAEASPKIPKQKAKRRVTFGHILLGLLCLLILAFIALAIVMRGSKWIM